MSVAKLAFYSHTGSISGAEIVLLACCRGLDRARFAPLLLSPGGELSAACEALDVPHVAVPAVRARFTRNPLRLAGYLANLGSSIASIRRALRRQHPDLVHANSVRAGLVASLATLGTGIPVLWHVHDILPPHGLTSLIRRLTRVLPHLHLLAVSKATAARFDRAGGRAIDVIYNSVDTDRFQPDDAARERMRLELGLREEQIAVGVIGQLTPRKGLLELVEAFAEQHDTMPDAILLLVGAAMFNDANHAYAKLLEQRIAELDAGGFIRLTGSRKDIPAVMNAMDLLAQNSFVEPLGMSLMEGNACGRTAAATGVDGVVEVIEHGRTGLLSVPHRTAELVQHIRMLVDDAALRQRLGAAARQRMIDHFSPARQMSTIHALYDRILLAEQSAHRITKARSA